MNIDSADDIDPSSDKVLLDDNGALDNVDEDSELSEEDVLSMNDSEDNSTAQLEQIISEDDEDEDEILQDALAKGGREAELAKQALRIKSKIRKDRGEEDILGSEEEGEDDTQNKWGGKRSQYYGGDEVMSSEEEDLEAEEQEAIRLQREQYKNLNLNDVVFDTKAIHQDEDLENDHSKALIQMEVQKKQLQQQYNQQYTADQLQQQIQQDRPELMVLISDLTQSLSELRTKTGPLLQEVRQGKLATKEGVSYLEAKNLLLLSYCIHIVFYLLLRAEGKAVKSHPVIRRLVEIRTYIEKIRPIDQKLKYQIDKLVKAAQVAKSMNQEDIEYNLSEVGLAQQNDGPNLDNFIVDNFQDTNLQGEQNGIYKAPKYNPVSLEQQALGKSNKQQRDQQRKFQMETQQAGRNSMIKALRDEIEGAPEEILDDIQESDKRAKIKLRNKLQARSNMEEDMMARVPLSKIEKQDFKRLAKEANLQHNGLENFADDAQGLVSLAKELDLRQQGVSQDYLKLQTQQKYSQDMNAINNQKRKNTGGDDNLPEPISLKDKRLQLDNAKARKSVKEQQKQQQGVRSKGDLGEDLEFDDDDVDGDDRNVQDLSFGINKGDSDEEFYRQAVQQSKQKKQVRFAEPKQYLPKDDQKTQGHRSITKEIQKNRGLTPHRKKEKKNPRVKQRQRFDKAQKKRAGQVQPVKQRDVSYKGETSGIKKNLSKSRKF